MEAPVDQGDLIDDCPLALVRSATPAGEPLIDFTRTRAIVLSQTCDLANQKSTFANVAEIFDVQMLIDEGLFKPSDVKGPLRAGRIWGCERIAMNVVQPAALDGELKLINPITMENIAGALIADGLATCEETDRLASELSEFARDPRTVMSIARIVQAWGWRSSTRKLE